MVVLCQHIGGLPLCAARFWMAFFLYLTYSVVPQIYTSCSSVEQRIYRNVAIVSASSLLPEIGVTVCIVILHRLSHDVSFAGVSRAIYSALILSLLEDVSHCQCSIHATFARSA